MLERSEYQVLQYHDVRAASDNPGDPTLAVPQYHASGTSLISSPVELLFSSTPMAAALLLNLTVRVGLLLLGRGTKR